MRVKEGQSPDAILSSVLKQVVSGLLDEYPDSHRVELLDSLNQILQKDPATRRPYIRGEVEEHLAGRAATRPIAATKNDIATFLRAKLKKDTRKIAMSKILEEEIIQKIPAKVSEM